MARAQPRPSDEDTGCFCRDESCWICKIGTEEDMDADNAVFEISNEYTRQIECAANESSTSSPKKV